MDKSAAVRTAAFATPSVLALVFFFRYTLVSRASLDFYCPASETLVDAGEAVICLTLMLLCFACSRIACILVDKQSPAADNGRGLRVAAVLDAVLVIALDLYYRQIRQLVVSAPDACSDEISAFVVLFTFYAVITVLATLSLMQAAYVAFRGHGAQSASGGVHDKWEMRMRRGPSSTSECT